MSKKEEPKFNKASLDAGLLANRIIRTLSDAFKKYADSKKEGLVTAIKEIGTKVADSDAPSKRWEFVGDASMATISIADEPDQEFAKNNITKDELWDMFQKGDVKLTMEVLKPYSIKKDWPKTWKKESKTETLKIEFVNLAVKSKLEKDSPGLIGRIIEKWAGVADAL